MNHPQNPFLFIPEKGRYVIYGVLTFASVFLGVLGILDVETLFGFATAKWLEVLSYLSAVGGATALTNLHRQVSEDPEPDPNDELEDPWRREIQ